MRLTRQRWDTISRAMNYLESHIEELEVMDDPDAVRERRQFESALEYVFSIKPTQKESK
jgi:hypothetical protein